MIGHITDYSLWSHKINFETIQRNNITIQILEQLLLSYHLHSRIKEITKPNPGGSLIDNIFSNIPEDL